MSENEAPEPTPSDDLDADEPVEDRAPDTDADADAARAKAVRLTQIGLVVAVVLILGIFLATRGGSDDDGDAKKGDSTEQADGKASGKPQWPSVLGGRPASLGVRNQKAPDVTVGADAKPGVYIWNDYDGWHLWVVGGGPDPVRGTLTSNDPIAKAELAVPGAGTVNVNDKVVTFELPGNAGLSGLDFNPGFFAKQLVFTLDGPTGPLDASLVRVGSKAAEAPFPLVFEKEVQGK